MRLFITDLMVLCLLSSTSSVFMYDNVNPTILVHTSSYFVARQRWLEVIFLDVGLRVETSLTFNGKSGFQ